MAGDDLLLQIVDANGVLTNDQITIENAYVDSEYVIEQFIFDDGSVLKPRDFNITINGTESNDTLVSGDFNNEFHGGAGDDTLQIDRNINRWDLYNHHNTFEGGIGNDRLEGYSGHDTYLFNQGDGQDVINDFADGVMSRTDKIIFGPGITADSLRVTAVGDDLLLQIVDVLDVVTGDQIIIENAYVNNQYAIEQFVFADGSVLKQSDLNVLVNSTQLSFRSASNIIESQSDGAWGLTDVSFNIGEQAKLPTIDIKGTIGKEIDVRNKWIIDPGWLPQMPLEGINNLMDEELVVPINAANTLIKGIDHNDMGIIDPGWLPQMPLEGIDNLMDEEPLVPINAENTLIKGIDHNDMGIIDPGWLPQMPLEGIDNLMDEELLVPINTENTLIKGIDHNDMGIIDPGWLPQTSIEGIDNSVGTDLDSALNQLVQAHSSFSDVSDETGFGKKDDGYRYTLPVPEPLI